MRPGLRLVSENTSSRQLVNRARYPRISLLGADTSGLSIISQSSNRKHSQRSPLSNSCFMLRARSTSASISCSFSLARTRRPWSDRHASRLRARRAGPPHGRRGHSRGARGEEGHRPDEGTRGLRAPLRRDSLRRRTSRVRFEDLKRLIPQASY